MTITREIFDAPSVDGTAEVFTGHMPDGRVWEAKRVDETNLSALVGGAASPFNSFEHIVDEISKEFEINQTTLLLGEWETSVGLPDDCLGQLVDIAERRARVIDRFRRKPEVTLAELQFLVDTVFPGTGIELIPGTDYFTFEYEFEMTFAADVNERFILVARIPPQDPQFEYDWEMTFERGIDLEKLRCYLEKIIPANVYLFIDEVSE